MTELMGDALHFMKMCLPGCIILIVLALLATRVNLKKDIRNRQILIPIFGLAYSVAASLLVIFGTELIERLVQLMQRLLEFLHLTPSALQTTINNWTADMQGGTFSQLLTSIANLLGRIATWFQNLSGGGLRVFLFFVISAAILLIYMLVKGIIIRRMRKRAEKGKRTPERLQSFLYEKDASSGKSYLKQNFAQTRTLLKVVNYTLIIALPVLAWISCVMFRLELMDHPMYPVMALILIGEVAYILDGLTKEEAGSLEGEDDRARHQVYYALLKDVLRGLFPDKLDAEKTTVSSDMVYFRTNREVLDELDDDPKAMIQNYGRFLNFQQTSGLILDHKYVDAGKDLLEGRSILFNNPFYYDLIPYLFYPMNRQLLRHKKILVVSGRQGIEGEIETWCREGLMAVNNTPTLWKIDLISEESQNLDVGILTRSMVHDLELQEQNTEFLSEVGMMVLVEPSHLLTTAQVGLNSLVRYSSQGEKKPVFCSIDKNCDGLLDALSHVLMVALTEVSATEHHSGRSTYMCWDGDSDHLQHRMLPNLSRYLGFGTELSVAALKNQIEQTWWYGGDAFPVVDIRWIAGQYYYDLLDYAALPASQETLDAKFHVASEMWSARKRDYQYLTVEDESNNLFEIRRDFSTRAVKEGFINVISPEYLLKDYMAMNDGIFRSDPKAIPYIVADYAHTTRNVMLRLCLRMAIMYVWESELEQELLLIDAPVLDIVASLWHEICKVLSFDEKTEDDVLLCSDQGKEYRFTEDIIYRKRKYNFQTGEVEFCYHISNMDFVRLYVNMLRNIEYVAEDEMGTDHYLGSEILGQIFQKYLPGQFFTLAGKYYELLRVNKEEKVILRRAADHIVGRESYRQVRVYRLENIELSEQMGDVKEWDGMQVSICYADITVNTPAYWKMDRYNDFETAQRVAVNGIPERNYHNKRLIKLGFEGGGKSVSPEICRTLTVLLNELFVTLFAENHGFLAAVTPGAQEVPITYSIEDCDAENCIYILEDSQMDIGLIEAAERNLDRMFSILCDYLDWDAEEAERSKNPPPEPEREKVEMPEPSDEEPEGGRKKRCFRRKKNRNRLGRRKKKKGTEVSVEEPVEEPIGPIETEEKPSEEEVETDTKGADAESTVMDDSNNPDGDSEEQPIVLRSVSGPSMEALMPKRKPYHERRYLFYGGTEIPEEIQPNETLEFLRDRGYGNSELKQAREGQALSAIIEDSGTINPEGKRQCDFCGVLLTGAEYETLQDGRDRCMNCSRTAIKTEEEFAELFYAVRDVMQSFFEIKLDAPVAVKMVNAQKLHRELGKSFVPTGNYDGRVLGVAISDRGGYTLMLENGSPKLSSAMTIAHEMTHIWQYENWDQKEIIGRYGKNNKLLIYEGMAKWVEIQYAYLIGETATARRETIYTRMRQDEYGQGFLIYESQYPLSEGTTLEGETPFMHIPPLQ